MTSKIFRSTVLVAIVVLLCSLGIILGALYQYFDDVQINQLKDELRLAAVGTEESGLDFLRKLESEHFRLTWVSSDGSVRYDTHADAATLGNHADREEIREALQTGVGEAFRLSETLMVQLRSNPRSRWLMHWFVRSSPAMCVACAMVSAPWNTASCWKIC